METQEGKELPSTSLEKASETDIASLIDIERSVQETNTYSPMLTEDEWRQELAESTVLLIKVGTAIVGSIIYTEKSPGHVHISGLVVRPEYQRRGLATKALEEVLARHPDAQRIDLVTHPDNPAREFYKSLGFTEEERKENYFGDGEPRLVLALTRAT